MYLVHTMTPLIGIDSKKMKDGLVYRATALPARADLRVTAKRNRPPRRYRHEPAQTLRPGPDPPPLALSLLGLGVPEMAQLILPLSLFLGLLMTLDMSIPGRLRSRLIFCVMSIMAQGAHRGRPVAAPCTPGLPGTSQRF